jgi:hypothetical protein
MIKGYFHVTGCENIALLRHPSYDLIAKRAKDARTPRLLKICGHLIDRRPGALASFGALGENPVYACLNRINFHETPRRLGAFLAFYRER